MAKVDGPAYAIEDVPAPQFDEETAADLARIVGIKPAKFEDDDTNSENILEYKAFRSAISNVLTTFYQNILDEKVAQNDQSNASNMESRDDALLDRAIDCSEFLAEYLLNGLNQELPELPILEELEEAAETIDQVRHSLNLYRTEVQARRKRAAPRRGRKRNDSLRSLVFGLACLYERYSQKQFTFFRHRGPAGDYVPVTDGHRFVLRAAQVWIGTTIDEKSVAVECERVRSQINEFFVTTPKNSPLGEIQNSRPKAR